MNDEEKLLERQKSLKAAWEVTCMLAMLFFYGRFCLLFTEAFLATHSLSILLYLCYELLIVGMLVIRNWPERVSSSPYDWTIGILGTTLPLLMQPSDAATHQIFLIIQMAGLVISAIGVMSLFKSFGIVAANRGVRTSGIYRFIRHPLYAGYFLSHSSFVIQNFSITNLAVFTAFSVFQILRIFAEEKFLAQDPVYADYMQKTRWRLLPFIW